MLANVRDTDGNTLLHHAVKHKLKDITLFLLSHGIPYNVINNNGSSAENLSTDETISNILKTIRDMFYAAESKKTIFLKNSATKIINGHFISNKMLVLNARQEDNANNYNVSSLLHKATKHEKTDIIQWLYDNGANLVAKDFYKDTALQIAENLIQLHEKLLAKKNVASQQILKKVYLNRLLQFVHAGISPAHGKLSYFNEPEERDTSVNITKILPYKINKVELMYDEIKLEIKGNLGCICICLDADYGNEIRKSFIEIGSTYGFKNIVFIDEKTAKYLDVMSQIKYKPVNGDVILIREDNKFYEWEIIECKAKFLGKWVADNFVLWNLPKVLDESKSMKKPDVMFYDGTNKKQNFIPLTDCEFFAYIKNSSWHSQGSLLKARLVAGDKNLLHLATENFLSHEISLKIRDKELTTFCEGQKLPINYSQKIIKTSDVLEIHRGRNLETVDLPSCNEILLNFEIQPNEIYSVTFAELSDK